jgi:hypothetical protein
MEFSSEEMMNIQDMAVDKESILKALGNFQVEEKGRTFTVRTSGDRIDVLQKIAKSIRGAAYSKAGTSSVGEVKAGAFKIIAKPEAKTSAGSGAGAYMTAVAECAQCYYCAAAWYGKDYSSKTLRETAKHVVADIGVEEVIKVLPDHWIVSCRTSAEVLKKKYGRKKYTFHRGSSLTNSIAANFNTINKVQKVFSNVNKWSPADIYMVTAEGQKKAQFLFEDINTLNNFMMNMVKSGDIIGVSLKQTKVAHLSEVNFGDKRPAYKFVSATTGKRGYFDSKDVYVNYDDGEIQFRGFPLTWQGEIKGKTANHGKLSGGPIKMIVDRFSTEKLDSQNTVESGIKTKSKTFYKKFHGYYVAVTGDRKMSEAAFTKEVQSRPLDWQVSKYLGTQLIAILNKSKNRQIIVSSMINYAKSQSDYSAPYVKVS